MDVSLIDVETSGGVLSDGAMKKSSTKNEMTAVPHRTDRMILIVPVVANVDDRKPQADAIDCTILKPANASLALFLKKAGEPKIL
ncbi:hypothetical protein D3C80_1985380 [compost metagenome]